MKITRQHRRLAAGLAAAGALGLVGTATAEAAFVTANDTSVRNQAGSSFSIGTLKAGEGFSVGAVRSDGWAWGYAGGEAQRCGWVLVSSLNSTTKSDTKCGDAQSLPLGDKSHASPPTFGTRYVYCDTATTFGNYAGGGNLRSTREVLPKGTKVEWYYTTGDGYAASINGTDATRRFILESCLGPEGQPPPAPAPAPAPPNPGTPPPPTGDATRPTVAGATVSRTRFRSRTTLRMQVSEAARVVVRVSRSGRGKGRYVRNVTAAGQVRVRIRGRRLPRGKHKLTVVAVDAAGNASAPVVVRVKRSR